MTNVIKFPGKSNDEIDDAVATAAAGVYFSTEFGELYEAAGIVRESYMACASFTVIFLELWRAGVIEVGYEDDNLFIAMAGEVREELRKDMVEMFNAANNPELFDETPELH